MMPEEKITNILKEKNILSTKENSNWKKHSWAVAQYCPEHLDPKKYNWENNSWAVAQFCPDKIDPKLYNWEQYSYYVALYCPNRIEPKLYNWKVSSSDLLFYHPQHKYTKNCIWDSKTIRNLKNFIRIYKNSILEKYLGEMDDLLDPTKRIILLDKISKAVTISKI